ncbi:virB8 family protein [Sphingomonas prati]|uniref:Type IV secretion system protein VirB8 n=1 Tax=Sphingomonas prati TaxID=1843237 RepID=A0A7W9BVL5_9SPHN|nr:VirB8/TrbF family protein [Sphingomonas prati]MBB5730957.1 type IV secretion system protein VirB8 [Sphingomonas prati]GGE98061.1 conjugal transfer protein TraJ [Sphingomonas prati]
MKKQESDPVETYIAQGGSWARDRQDNDRASRRIAWIVAAGASTIAVCEALALVVLMPLKTVEPLTLLVDRQTGFVQALRPLEPEMIAGDTALTQSFLVQYVIAREGFDAGSLQTNYRKIALWSSGAARAQYIASMQASNPASPLSAYPRSTVIDVQVKSVTPLTRNAAMVRYDTTRQDPDGRRQPVRSWVTVIRYLYAKAPLSVADRYVNPLGFQVTSFHRSQEALSPTVIQGLPQVPQSYAPQEESRQSSMVPSRSPVQELAPPTRRDVP